VENWLIFVVFAGAGLGLACLAVLIVLIYRTIKAGMLQLALCVASAGQLESRMAALETARAGAQRFASSGLQAQVQYSQRRQAAIFEAIAAFKQGHKPQDILLAVAQKYPDVAVQLAQNPDVIMQDIKRLGISLPPELLAQLGPSPLATPPSPVKLPEKATPQAD